jgi:hypothetical protein
LCRLTALPLVERDEGGLVTHFSPTFALELLEVAPPTFFVSDDDVLEALGRHGGGCDTMACVIADGHAIAFLLVPDQIQELPQAIILLDCLPCVLERVMAHSTEAATSFASTS